MERGIVPDLHHVGNQDLYPSFAIIVPSNDFPVQNVKSDITQGCLAQSKGLREVTSLAEPCPRSWADAQCARRLLNGAATMLLCRLDVLACR